MTREDEFERRLADWLESGPVTAPDEVVAEGIERTRGRRQRPAWWSWLFGLADRLRARDDARRLGLLVVLVLTLLAALAVTVPLAGGPGPAPEMDPLAVRHVSGTVETTSQSSRGDFTERVLDVDAGDVRTRGQARQLLRIEDGPDGVLQRFSGVMRLQNDWGIWEGPVNGVRYPDGTEIEYGWLAGQGAYEDFTYFHSTRDHPAEAERVLEGAIWPGEPPPMPDPSLLQADPLD